MGDSPVKSPLLAKGEAVVQLNITNALVSVLVVVAFGFILSVAKAIFLPLAIALLLFFLCLPIVNFLTKLKIPQVLAIIVVILMILSIGVMVGAIVFSSIRSLIQDLPDYQARLENLVNMIVDQLEGYFPQLEDFSLQAVSWGQLFGAGILQISDGFFSFVSGLFTVMIFLFFLLLEEPYFRSKTRKAWSYRTGKRVTIFFGHINRAVTHYLSVKLLISFITSLVVLLLLSLVGVRYPILWAILTFLFNFIPVFGPIIISIVCTLFVQLQFFPDPSRAIIVGLGLMVVQMILGNFLEPKMMSDRLNLSPLVILIGFLSWGLLWGTAGLFLAAPLTGFILIAIRGIRSLRSFSILMQTTGKGRGGAK